MAQYTKHNSNYIKTKRHQFLKDGSTIFERDWVTIGSQLHFGSGKIPYYNNGNFIFTTSPTPTYQKKHKNGVVVGTWTYDDVKDASAVVNEITVDEHTEDIRSFAYYGSCVELVRSSVENIINTFPGNITLSDDRLEIPPTTEDGDFTFIEGYIVNNPFDINLYLKDISLTQYDNELRFMSYSWDKYLVNGNEIKTYSISDWMGDINCPQNDQYYIKKAPVITVTINGTIVLKGYKADNDIVFCYEGNTLDIRPKEEYIEEYFNNLTGFEKQLLNRESKPLYSNRFVTPIEYNLGFVYYKRTYTWPSNDYCIDVVSPLYIDFINKLTDMAQLFDELWTDNIWRRMTHEAIKNYDWTYTREFEDGEEQDNIDGGERMHKVLNIIGRTFDDIKRYIDLIKQSNTITYNADRNIPSALISDKLELRGWDVYSTIPVFEGNTPYSEVKLDDSVFNANIKWYGTKNYNEVSFADVDVDFMRRLMLSSRRILQTKGTIQGIDMIMGMFGYGENDYKVTEEYMTVQPKLYDSEYDSEYTFGDKIVQINFNKQNELIYDNDVSGIPVGSFTVNELEEDGETLSPKTYLIPYYDQTKFYDGNFCFQSKGGWFYDKTKQSGEDLNEYGWQETLSYLHVVSRISDLLDVNPNSVRNGDIYYVVNVSDIVDYSEEDYKFYSNFFVLEDDFNPETFSSWTLLDLSGETYKNDENTSNEVRELNEKYMKYVEKANYLNSIIPDNIGNNPHVGYGRYDNGNEYVEYMRKPFKYAIDSNNLEYLLKEEAEKILFDISIPIATNKMSDKIQIFANKINAENVKYYGREYHYGEYDRDSIKELSKTKYYLNSKVIHFKNNIDNEYYKQYFKEVIMKYIMQVVPSTTIMILEDF